MASFSPFIPTTLRFLRLFGGGPGVLYLFAVALRLLAMSAAGVASLLASGALSGSPPPAIPTALLLGDGYRSPRVACAHGGSHPDRHRVVVG